MDDLLQMAREQRGSELEGWRQAGAQGDPGITALGEGVAAGFRRGGVWADVGLAQWPPAAQVGRLKMLQRTMSGRASLPLLQQRVVYQPPALPPLRLK